MQTYWLVTEPARGLSFRVNVDPEGDPPEEYLAKDRRLVAERASWLAYCEETPDDPPISFKEWLEGDGNTVHLIEEA